MDNMMNARPRVYVTRNIPREGVELLSKRCDVTQWDSDEVIPRDVLLANVRGVHGILCLLTDTIDHEVFEAAGPQLKVVSTMSVGYDHIDLAECKQRNIQVGNTPAISTDAVAELGVTLLLATSRRVVEGVEKVKNGEWGPWKPMWLCGPGLQNSTVGLLGLGRIGFGVAQRLKAFGVKKLMYNDIRECSYAETLPAEFVTFDTLVQECGFVVICCNLSPETTRLFNKAVFQKMKTNAILINISRGAIVDMDDRGPIVDMDDLYEALSTGQIKGAGLDVTEPEPLPPTSPLLTLKNCVILPHMGSNVDETRVEMATLSAMNVVAGITGEEMPGEVDG